MITDSNTQPTKLNWYVLVVAFAHKQLESAYKDLKVSDLK